MAYRTIILKDIGHSISKEGKAGSEVYPGMLLIGRAADESLIPHATAADVATVGILVARENELAGKDIDTPYASGDRVFANAYRKGDEVLLLVPANADAIAKEAELETAGGGRVRLRTSGAVIGRALEAVDNSAGSDQARIPVELS